jgi:hypothetical protein
MDGDTELPSPGDLVGGNIAAEDEGSVLRGVCCQLSCISFRVLHARTRHNGNLQASR